MTGPSARVITDSVSPEGVRLTTLVVRFHRFVLAEFNTHRVFSRSSASSRAIPVQRMYELFLQGPAYPVEWPAEQAGMQGGEPLTGDALIDAEQLWLNAFSDVKTRVGRYLADHPKETRVHKSILNRLMEPFLFHEVIVASTEWNNFFTQRCSPLAQPEIRAAAELMQAAINSSTPTQLDYGDWHLPFISPDELGEWPLYRQIRVAVARCARVSYLNHDGVYDPASDERLFRRLVTATPPHHAPLEMVATPQELLMVHLGNFQGWFQLRHARQMIGELTRDQDATGVLEEVAA